MGQKVGGLFRLNHPTWHQGGVLHAVDDVFVGRAEGGLGAAEAGLAGDHKIIRAQAQVAVGTRDGGHRGRGPDSGVGAPQCCLTLSH